jgi:rod shape determining protein RodA
MREKSDSIFYNVDWLTVGIFLCLIVMGWFNIYSAVYDPVKSNIFDTHRQESKQMIFIAISVLLAFVILVIDASFFTATAFIIFVGIILLNVAVRFLGRDIKGSYSWFDFGAISLQPAEFAKWATGLALAKYLSGANVSNKLEILVTTLGIIFLPVFIIVVVQNETGCALVFAAFIFVLYREGIIPGFILLFGILFSVAFIIGIKYPGVTVPLDRNFNPIKGEYIFHYRAISIFVCVLFSLAILRLLTVQRTLKQIAFTMSLVAIFSNVYISSPIILEKLPDHMKGRIKCWLGLPVPRPMHDKYAYNTEQSMIAIGSGGWFGKGYLQGTQTKFKFVPEQETDFIFCTVGEEWGFVGTAFIIILYLVLIMRLIIMSERQRSDFTRIFGYSVAAIFFIHLIVNVGMTIGLLPVIGIPLPFFSYGGSSLISFTILLFIFVKLDSQRLLVLR